MSVTLQLEELLGYSDQERARWREWVQADPRRLEIPFQSGGRFPTIGSLFDHVFLVERRHLSRLEGGVPPDSTGVAAGDWKALFEYADLVRADFRRYAADVNEAVTAETLTFNVSTGPATMTRRKLAFHIVIHELRHFAQIAYAVRVAGQEPPGRHDLFYYAEFA